MFDLKNPNRLKFLRITVCLGFLFGILFSHELWFAWARTFPRVPLIFEVPILAEQIISVILVISLLLTALSFRPKIFLISAVSSLVLLISFDQMRLQPWVYQYLLLLIIIALSAEKSDQTLLLSQIIVAGLYFWSGLQKINFTFSHETLPLILLPLQNLFPAFQLPFILIGSGIALSEFLIGCGLFFRKTRNFVVVSAVAMHTAILILLIVKNYNSIVWIWNAVLMVLIVILFWKNDVSIKQVFKKTNDFKLKAVTIGALASVLLPILSFVGWWDMYLSGALYSGNVEIGVVRINDNLLEKLPPNAQKSVFRTNSTGEQMLPVSEWSMADLNVPVYPETRIFKQAAREVCKLTNEKKEIELIIKERPAIFDGSYKITRISCEQIER